MFVYRTARAVRTLSKMPERGGVLGGRWMTVPFAFIVQLSIGSVYAWSTFNSPLTRQLGVLVPAADDWGLVRARVCARWTL